MSRSLNCVVLRALFAAVTLGARGAPATAQTSPGLPPWVAVDSGARIVTVTLDIVGGGAGSPASIAGFDHGRAQLVVPLGWTVKWRWTNRDSVNRHSLVVMAEREKLPSEGGRPVFDNAMTRMVTAGLKPGETDLTSFEADQAGWYWMLCGVAGHALRGEWIGLKVDRAATLPSLFLKPPS